MKYAFEMEMRVRDYETDFQGIVNNANYMHYTEHTRAEFLRRDNVSCAELHERGIDTVVARAQLAYKTPLRAGDVFVSRLAIRKEGLRFVFVQDLFRLPDEVLCLHAETHVVCIVNGRLAPCPELDERFEKYYYTE